MKNSNVLNISLGNCGRSRKIGFWKNGCITLRYNQEKFVLYYNNTTNKIEVRIFNNSSSDVYSVKHKKEIELTDFTSNTIKLILNDMFYPSGFENHVVTIDDPFIQTVIHGIDEVCRNSTPDIVKNMIKNMIKNN